MRIPTLVIVNDDNPELTKLATKAGAVMRVYVRDSLDGEKLYGIREGVLYFDERGDKQFIHQDEYDRTLRVLRDNLLGMSSGAKTLMLKYLARKDKNVVENFGTQLDKLKDEQLT